MVNNERQTGRLISEETERKASKTGGSTEQFFEKATDILQVKCQVDCIFAIQKALTMDDNWVGHVPL